MRSAGSVSESCWHLRAASVNEHIPSARGTRSLMGSARSWLQGRGCNSQVRLPTSGNRNWLSCSWELAVDTGGYSLPH